MAVPVITIYTEGSSLGNPGKGGFGVVQLDKNIIKHEYSKFSDLTTNNREELKAIIQAFELASIFQKEVTIYSDSAYAVNMINDWIWNWAKNDWKNSKKKEVENIDLVKIIYNYITKENYNCQVIKIKGHAGEVGNELADALATLNHKKFIDICEKNDLKVNVKI
jgi:ribonuclease HI